MTEAILAKVRRHYLEQPEDSSSRDLPPGAQRFIIHLCQRHQPKPIGYIQYYRDLDYVPDQTAVGIDLFLANPGDLNRGLGTAVLSAFVELIRDQEQAAVIVVDPNPANSRAIGCYQKAGFLHHRTVIGSDGALHYLMTLPEHDSSRKG
jgi:RimJ/RimL family protein N-acetyltransferase